MNTAVSNSSTTARSINSAGEETCSASVSVGWAATKGPGSQLRGCGVTVPARVGPGCLEREVSLTGMIPVE